MSDYIYRVVLKQHTPIIHFQHQQAGATLRVSELKPKLDAYLIKKIGDQTIKPEWRVGTAEENRLALDYRVKIKPVKPEISLINKPYRDKNNRLRLEPYPSFFANMGNIQTEAELENHRKFSYSSQHLEVVFYCTNTELKKELETHFPRFLAMTNFGMRQSKGFGCFYLQGQESFLSNVLPYHFDVAITAEDHKELFKTIDLFYRSLRAGINLSRDKQTIFYFKSLLFVYAKNKLNIQWEKKEIKQKFFLKDWTDRNNGYEGFETQLRKKGGDALGFTSSNKRLLRDLLGLSSNESWLSYRNSITKEHQSQTEDQLIQRFASPILFKPVKTTTGFRVYFGPIEEPYQFPSYNNKPMSYLGQRFRITTVKPMSGSPLSLALPDTFNIKDFFHHIFKEKDAKGKPVIDLHSHVEQGFHDSREFKSLKKIYDQLQK